MVYIQHVYKGLAVLSNGVQFWRAFLVSESFWLDKHYIQLLSLIKSSFCFLSFIGVIPRAFPNILHANLCLRIYFLMAIIGTQGSQVQWSIRWHFCTGSLFARLAKKDIISGGQRIIVSTKLVIQMLEFSTVMIWGWYINGKECTKL